MPTQVIVETLQRLVDERQAFLETLVRDLIEVMKEHSQVIKEEQGSCHTRVTRELKFAAFTVTFDEGQSSMGGNDLCVEHGGRVVLNLHTGGASISVRDMSDWVIDTWEQKPISLFREALNNAEKILFQEERDRVEEENRRIAKNTLNKRYVDLVKDAKRLGVHLDPPSE